MTKRRIFIAGHKGMVGSALVRILSTEASVELIVRTRAELDLTNQLAVNTFINDCRPDEIYLAAARVGGIHANNTYPASFIQENLQIESNIIGAAHTADVQKLLFLGSSCIYPREASQPMREEALLSGYLEPTNEPYAIAKIAGIKLCESFNRQYGRNYRSVMPTNLYGPGDYFHPENSHVIPALMRRFHEAVQTGAAEVVIWGSGKPMREFLHVDDLAAGCVHVMNLPEETIREVTSPRCSHLNVGTGKDCSIRELAEIIGKVTGFQGKLVFDASKPDGPPRKLLDVCRLESTRWQAAISLEKGLQETYQWYLSNQQVLRS
jgi:GDP-L-fucose synthase